jgi:hypothetical protein
MQAGEIVANISVLNDRFRIAVVDELVARKRAGTEEMMLLDPRELEDHCRALDELEARLVAAHEVSRLPNEPTSAAALDDFVVRLRLDAARAAST